MPALKIAIAIILFPWANRGYRYGYPTNGHCLSFGSDGSRCRYRDDVFLKKKRKIGRGRDSANAEVGRACGVGWFVRCMGEEEVRMD